MIAIIFGVMLACVNSVLSLPHELLHPTGRIINGADATDGQFPYIVSIRYPDNFHICGGSIISSTWILTAGHCCAYKKPQLMTVHAGTNTLDHGGEVYKVSKINLHPEFNLTDSDLINDICLIQLSSEISETVAIQKVQLDNSNDDSKRNATLAGWGSTVLGGESPKQLQWLELYTVPHDECVDLWGNHAYYPIRESQICGFARNGQGACHGDSGSALTVKVNGKFVAVGITSWVDPCALGLPDIYTRVSSYLPWIKEVTQENF